MKKIKLAKRQRQTKFIPLLMNVEFKHWHSDHVIGNSKYREKWTQSVSRIEFKNHQK